MVRITNLIFLALALNLVCGQEDKLQFDDMKHRLFTDRDDFHIQKLLFALNYFDFCILPRQSHIGIVFLQAFYRQYGVDMNKFHSMINDTDSYLERTYKRYDTPRIPHVTHRVWLTDPLQPREMMSVLVNQTLQDLMFDTNKVLEQSGGEWKHYLWTIDRTLIPQTVEFFEKRGVIVRDMSELQVWNSTWKDIFEKQLEGGMEIGKACDVARFMIMHDQGGLYLDLDAYIMEWTNDFHYYFDFVSWAEHSYDFRVLTTWSWLQRPRHEVSGKYLDLYLTNYLLPEDEKPFNINRCQGKTAGSVLYNTGVYFFSLAYYMAQNQHGNQDIIVMDPSNHDVVEIAIKTTDNEVRKLRVALKQIGQGSWTQDFHDILNFGWFDLI